MLEQALGGLRVIDLTRDIAGPYCTKMLAALGAEVIKIEQPGIGDRARRMGPFLDDDPHPEKSGPFLYLNTGKKSVTLDISTVTGRKLLLELVGQADLLIESFAPTVMPSWGLSYEELKKLNPRLVVTSISDFGEDGPYRDYRATDMVSYAYGGQLYMTGDPEREPLRNGGQQAQYQTGLIAFTGTMSALMARQATGEGQHVDISAMEAVASVLKHATIIWSYIQEKNSRTGNSSGGMAGYGLYPTKDGHIAMAAGGNMFGRLQQLIDDPRLADPRFLEGGGRKKYREEIDAVLVPWLENRGKKELYHEAQKMRLPFGPVSTTEDLANSEQLQSREYFVEIEHPVAGTQTYPGISFHMSETPAQFGRAPLLGEHNKEILCGRLGLSPQDLVILRERGII